ncbi:MAG: acyl-ACP--UDP-N-acetylglucosamine O-acyltransferase [Rickettsiales bacterium]|jgi:UDP-N-acetylglucosamine acyltransferase|nr:acyl-ACP--UDP-N-acetylglucosamine O-acyltransferase [Rickettsiales bacterium]
MNAKSNQLIPDEVLFARKGVEVHPTSMVSPKAEIGEGTVIGPWCIIGDNVSIGRYNTLKSNAIIEGNVAIGDGSFIHQFVTIGNHSHDLKFSDAEKTTVTIGAGCVVREFTNIHAGTPNSPRGTWIGDDVYLMSHCHIGHDCEIFDHAILSQGVTLGGEVIIQERAIIGGGSSVHQFCTVGAYAIVGGMTGVSQDVIPYGMSAGIRPQNLDGLNLVGLKRNNFSIEDIRIIKDVYKDLFLSSDGLWAERVAIAKSVYDKYPVAHRIFEFIEKDSRRIIAKPRGKYKTEPEEQ